MADERDLIIATWSGGIGGTWDPKTLPVLRLPVPVSVDSRPMDFEGSEQVSDSVGDVVEFFVVKHAFNGDPVDMVHGRLRGVEVNVSLDPPQIVVNDSGEQI